jgi:hypothetical protein
MVIIGERLPKFKVPKIIGIVIGKTIMYTFYTVIGIVGFISVVALIYGLGCSILHPGHYPGPHQ